MENSRFDQLFLTITDGVQGIDNLLDVFFGFLRRRTDFFESSEATKVTLQYLEKHRNLAQAKIETKLKYEQARKLEKQKHSEQTVSKSHPQVEEVIDDVPIATAPPKKETNVVSGNKDAPIGNGGVTDKYTWTQTLTTLDVLIPLNKKIERSTIKVTITGTTLKVIVNNEEILSGKFHMSVKSDDSIWTLEDRKVIHLVLEKVDQMQWWSCVLQGDPSIDTQKIVPENSKLNELDPELRQTVEKMMFDQEQKALGLPTSDQRKQAEILEKFKQSHPEMDFSNAKINWGN